MSITLACRIDSTNSFSIFRRRGAEGVFKRLRRICEKGSENKKVNYARLLTHANNAARAAFPNIGQPEVNKDVLEEFAGDQWENILAGVQARVHPERPLLAKAAYNPGTSCSWLPKPKAGHKTCPPSAHTQQLGMEECLLQWSGQASQEALAVLTRSWACELVHTVGATAVDLENPTVLASEAKGCAWLITASLGRCLVGWPLEIAAVDGCDEDVFPSHTHDFSKLGEDRHREAVPSSDGNIKNMYV